MSHIPHHRAVSPAPSYKLPPSANPRRTNRFTAHEFPKHFRSSRASPRPRGTPGIGSPSRPRNRSSTAAVWPTVFAITMVANLVPAALANPTLPFSRHRLREAHDASADAPLHSPDAADHAGGSVDDVRSVPMAPYAIKTDYPFPDLMRAIGAASAPFRNLGRMLNDASAVLTGKEIDRKTLDTMQHVGDFVDRITALIPQVQSLRVVGHAAEIAGEAASGKPPDPEQLSAMVQMSDPRAFGANIPMQPRQPAYDVGVPEPAPAPANAHAAPDDAPAGPNAQASDDAAALAKANAGERDDMRAHGATNADADKGAEAHVEANAGKRNDAVARKRPDAIGNDGVNEDVNDGVIVPDNTGADDGDVPASHEAASAPDSGGRQDASAPLSDIGRASAPSSIRWQIHGEREHLRDYAQALPPVPLPAAPRRQLIVANGRYYLAGEAGYYHLTRAPRTNQWLVNAPRGTRAQVPVTYDAQTGQWQAQAPLRLCGGGCGPSRESTPDSVAMSQGHLADAIRHIEDPNVRDAIQLAYSDLGHLHLLRTNREDLRALRDNSIVEHRRVLVPQLMRLDPYSTLFEQQREAAQITAIHYDTFIDTAFYELSPEAFCQENAEILFHYLLTRGVPSHHIRMITVHPQGRPPHVMVLYTESDQFIDLLDLSTPQPPVPGHVDGISGERFTAALFLTRDATVLLDPWSRIKASSFRMADEVEELMGMLDTALADTGHRAAAPFRVSITRPYPAPRDHAAASRTGSSGSSSTGSLAGRSF